MHTSETRREFEAIGRPLMPAIYGAALRLVRNKADACDLVQESYLRAFRTFANFAPGTNAKAWLLTIVHTVFVNSYHRANRERARLSFAGDELDAAVAAESFARYAEENMAARFSERSTEIMAGLDGLADVYRLAVMFVDMDEMSYDEAAAALGCPVGTLRSRLFRGRRLLAIALRDLGAGMGLLRQDSEADR